MREENTKSHNHESSAAERTANSTDARRPLADNEIWDPLAYYPRTGTAEVKVSVERPS